MMVGLRPFFSYYGGKWRDAVKYYPPPEHDHIVEPFAGSAGYALRHFDRRITLCEVDPQIYEVWKYLIRVKHFEVLALPDLADGQTTDDLDIIPPEARWLIGLWLNKGASSPRKSPSKWMRSGIRPGCFWGPRVRSTIACQVERIRHWRILRCDYTESPPIRATWFVDPPYQNAGSHYRFGSSKIDYAALALWCRGLQGQAIVCENDGATWLPFRPLASVKTSRAASRSAEAIWTRSS